ncbi:hypothetical protein NLY43_18935 [Mesorhizobium sp. C416B]|uniref:hypothetical protein n=1 Tax=unclassified Mesorhizobium TaxID=325217 RepID=UPI0003CDF2A9|nr:MULTISPECIES: hypothetical protein [unclassified Mesorhizobium]ESX51356.1 hypothetical protein X762_04905 [Mesorhizobium sp. LSHC426A00]ESX52728.1 hypothetical protein X761_22825 [Mesorhizobium sp. LSHC424B00]ESX66836.1 hypothetical protein X758_25255 [Mesorhizobium sp. LSHC416B00]WJI60698.1 hypothetical protein NLY43_18935 [Mesorhizobium sp. C416B]
MQIQKIEYVPWRDRAFVSIAEAGEIVARSTDWVRNRIAEGRLHGCRVTRGGPLVVTVRSLVDLVDGALLASAPPPGPRLYLAIDNT